jgi:hypothetical protein
MEKTFRYVVVLSMVLFVLYWILPFIDYLWLTEEQLEFARYDTWGASIPNHPLIYWGVFTIWLVISAGLFFFVPIARAAFVIMQVISFVATFFWGFLVVPPVSAAIGSMAGLIDGVIIAMLFLTSVASKFNNTPNKKLNVDSGADAPPPVN